jgi:hypothetical protein
VLTNVHGCRHTVKSRHDDVHEHQVKVIPAHIGDTRVGIGTIFLRPVSESHSSTAVASISLRDATEQEELPPDYKTYSMFDLTTHRLQKLDTNLGTGRIILDEKDLRLLGTPHWC